MHQDLTVLCCDMFILRQVVLWQLRWPLWWLGIRVRKLCIQTCNPSSSHSPYNKAFLITFTKCQWCVPVGFVYNLWWHRKNAVDQILTSISVDLYNSQVTWLLIPKDTQTHYCVSSFHGWLSEKERKRQRQYVMSWYCKSIWDGQIAHRSTANSFCWSSVTHAGCEAKSSYLLCHGAKRGRLLSDRDCAYEQQQGCTEDL